MKIFRLLHMLLCGTLLGALPVAAGPLRIVLLSEATIQGDAIFFSHLLPPGATPELLSRSAKLLLGGSPAPGFSRRIDRESLNAYLKDANFPLDDFLVPETVTVWRQSHYLTGNDVSEAINSHLARGHASSANQVRTEELQLDMPALSFVADPRLCVTEVVYDKQLRSTRFRLSSREYPKTPPFYAWLTATNNDFRANQELPSYSAPTPDSLVRENRSTGVVLVEPNRLASLYLHSSNLSTVLRVRPLQPGQNGETIRVRIPRNGKTLRARVVGTDCVEAVF